MVHGWSPYVAGLLVCVQNLKSPIKHGWVAWKVKSPNWGPGQTQNNLKAQNSKNNQQQNKSKKFPKRETNTSDSSTHHRLTFRRDFQSHSQTLLLLLLKMQNTNLVQVQELWFSKPTMMVRTQQQLSLQTKTHIIGSFSSSSSNAQVLHSSPALSSPPNQIPPRVPSPSPERIQANPTRTNRSDLPPPRSPTTRRPIQPLLRLLRRTRRLRSPKTPFKP